MATPAAAATPPVYPAARTRFVAPRAPAGGWGALDETVWETPRDNPMVASLPFINWSKPAAPVLFSAPASELMGVLISAATFSEAAADRASFEAANLVVHEISNTGCSTFAHELANGGIFEKSYSDLEDFIQACVESTLLNRSALRLTARMVNATEAFDGPGGAAGPAELEYLRRVSWWSILSEGAKLDSALPCLLLSRVLMLLGSKSRRNTRSDDMSEFRISAELFRSYVVRVPPALDSAATEGAIARKVCTFLRDASQALLPVMRSEAASMAAMRDDFGDAFVLITGRDAEISSTLWRRAAQRLDKFSTLSVLKPVVNNAAELRIQAERLATYFLPSYRGRDAFSLLHELERELVARSKRSQLRDLVTAHSDLAEIITVLITTSKDAGLGGDGVLSAPASGPATAGGASVGGGTLQASRADQAISAPSFRSAMDDCDNLTGVKFLERCFRSGSAILVRYCAMEPVWLRARSPFFENAAKGVGKRHQVALPNAS